MTLRFVPPKEEAKQIPRYASYVVGVGMKLHSSVGHAKQSFNNRGWTRVTTDEVIGEQYDGSPRYRTRPGARHSFILENVEGDWYVLYEVPEGTGSDDLPWVKEFIRDTKYYWDNGQLLSDFNASEYRVSQREESPERFKTFKKVVPMSRDEYVAWRLAVQLEILEAGK